MIKIVNRKTHNPTTHDIYVGRGSALGNPYVGSKKVENTKAIYQCKSREESIYLYRDYLVGKIAEKDEVICNQLNLIYKLAIKGDINLVCYCAPKFCHAEIIKRIIDEKIK